MFIRTMERLLSQINRVARDVRFVGLGFVMLVFLIKLLEYAHAFQPFVVSRFIGSLYRDMRSELVSVAVAVLIYEWLTQRRIRHLEQNALLLQLGSPDNVLAREAARVLQAKGWLTDGTLKEMFLVRANLERADLWRADLRGTELMKGNFACANFHKANLSGAQMWEADLHGAELMEVSMVGTVLSRSDMRDTKLWEAHLERAVMDYVDLSGSNLRNANLKDAVLIHANLRGVNFQKANLQGARLVNAVFDETTILPDGTNWSPEVDMMQFTGDVRPDLSITNEMV